ncbi:hypothetical protein [Thermophilibacter provencensis]|uniref:hypothetical protein n=1 Tax=Thermophilibacter provencensis TaxID=1852386 RepID=UPI002942C8A1|nr:hypothetical protein [Thermophilibacter provencensis]
MDQELIARSMRDLAREFDSCRDLLVALGNENRQLIFMALLESHSGARVGELARVTSDAERFVRAMVALEARGEGCSHRDGKDVSDREERPDDHDAL